jgi:putative nucleotidyltransferase with HDIG domain
MRKKIDVRDLRIGMYVSELDRPWLGTPFLFQGFEVRTEEELHNLRQLCRHVHIDTDPGSLALARKPVAIPDIGILKSLAAGNRHQARYTDLTTLEGEIPRAREMYVEARTLIHGIMEDVRLGKSLDSEGARKSVTAMTESVIRNPDALACFTQLKKKDEYTALHSLRVCILALTFGRHLDFTPDQLYVLGMGALLHDIGKMKVPNEILNKPARLTEQEFEVMKSHVPHGVAILEKTPGIPAAAIEVARGHHERYGGQGYIFGLKGDAIGLFGSIGGVVDSYDALTSDRSYHDGRSAYDTLTYLYNARRIDFHPDLIAQFIQCMGIYPIGSIVELNTGDIGVVITVNRVRRLKPRVALVLTPEKKPCSVLKIVDLMQPAGHALEIRKVLPAGAHGINAVDHLPLHVGA